MKLPSSILGPLLCLGLLAGCLLQTPPAERTQTISLYFYSENDLHDAFFENPVIVTRTISLSEDAMDAALRLLFAGPTEKDVAQGARISDDLTRLGALYLDVRREDDGAIVNFKREALQILNSAAARQFMAKEPIRRTLLQFQGIQDVRYAIDGEIFEEWDA